MKKHLFYHRDYLFLYIKTFNTTLEVLLLCHYKNVLKNSSCMKLLPFILIYFTSSIFELTGQNIQVNTFGLPKESGSEKETITIDFGNFLNKAKQNDSRSSLQIELNLKNSLKKFTAYPNEVINEEFKRLYPDIFTFDLKSDESGFTYGNITLSPSGFYATLKYLGQLVTIYPAKLSDPDIHTIEYGFQKEPQLLQQFCGHDHSSDQNIRKPIPERGYGLRSDFTLGSKRYNYRVAVATTGEFYQKNGNNDIQVMTVVVNSINSINAIFSNELSFRFTLGSNVFMHKNPITDPFIPDQTGGRDRSVQAGMIIPMNFNASQFDIGHVFHQHNTGDGWTTGGLAWIGGVCSNFVNSSGQLIKASGWTGNFTNTGNSWVNLLAHEFGHQFGANHTFNGSGNSCTESIAPNNAFEIGSGSTIMSYNGICDISQNIPSGDVLDNYFHVKSLEEIYNYVYEGQGGNCGSPVNSPNALPQVTANPCTAEYNIPKGTPFYLQAASFTSDNDIHTYSWEQIDEDGQNIRPTQGLIATAAANSALAPLFRSFPPSAKSDRFFPSLDVLNSPGGSDPFEVLPNVARELNFNICLRDNNAGGGAVANDDVKITVSATGPFVITKPQGGETFQAGQTQILTWNTNGSNALCNNMRIKMSIDGGNTFPIIIAENVVYSAGSFSYAIPANTSATTKAKIIMECMDYDCFKFFDISNSNFTINSTCAAPESVLCSTSAVAEDRGSQVLNLNMFKLTGNQIFTITKNINTSLPAGNVAVRTNDDSGCKIVSSYYFQRTKVFVTESGIYDFKIEGDGFVSIFSPQYVNTSGCTGFIQSSAKEAAIPGNINKSQYFSVELRACTDYEFIIYSFAPLPTEITLKLVSGPGILFEKNSIIPNDYQHLFVLVNKTTDNVALVGQGTDFRSIGAGQYMLYSIVIDKNVNLSSLTSLKYTQIKNSFCINESLNSREITIKPTCEISDLTVGNQSTCSPINNKYSQDVILTYSTPPASGQININNQLFNITSSPQTIQLAGLESDGNTLNVTAFFTANETCTIRKSNLFTAPASCCPINLELGSDIVKCENEGAAILQAGIDPNNQYVWTKNGQAVTSNNGGILMTISSGFYRVEVSHSSGCKKSDSIRVTIHIAPSVSLKDNLVFCEKDTLTLTATTIGSTSIQWLQNNILIPGNNSGTIKISSGGKYKAIVSNEFGCKNDDETTVVVRPLPSVALGVDIQKCIGDGTVKLEAGTDTTNVYKWTKDGQLVIENQGTLLFVNSSGQYSVEVKNSAGCKRSDTIQVVYIGLPVVNLQDNQRFCENEKYTLTANISGAINIQWFRNNSTISGAILNSIEINSSGTYKIIVSNQFGCKAEDMTLISTIKAPQVELGNNLIKCNGESTLLSAGLDGFMFAWFKDGILVQNTIQNTYLVVQTGTYRVVATNENQCKTEDQVKVDFFAPPVIEDFPKEIIGCQGTPLELIAKASNYSSLQWYYENNIIGGSNSLKLPVFNSGDYGVEATNIAGCKTRKDTRVDVKSLPFLNLGPDIVACTGSVVVLFAGTEGILYKWAKDGVPIFNAENNLSLFEAGTYQVSVTNSFNCTATDEKKISYNSGPDFTVNGDAAICTGESWRIIVTTNVANPEVRWFRNTELIPEENGLSLNVTLSGNYEAWVKGGPPGCTAIKSVIVTVNPPPAFNLGNDRTLCDPEIFPVLNAGQNNKSFIWSLNGTQISTSQTVTADKSGIYSVKVKTAFGCERTEQVKITISSKPSLTINPEYMLCEGSILVVTAETNGTRFQWRRDNFLIPNATLKTISIIQPGMYSITSANEADCRTERSFMVAQKPKPILKLGTDTSLCPNTTKLLSAGIHTSYNWSDGSKSSTINFNSGTPAIKSFSKYSVTVTNEFGCVAIDSIVITLLPVLKANVKAENESICKGSSVLLTGSGGTNYTWSESGGGNTLTTTNQPTTTAKPIKSTIYTVEASDNVCTGNKEIKSIEIKVFDDTAVSAGRDTCIILGRSIKLKATGGISYSWDNSDIISGATDIAEPIATPIKETEFKVTITDSNKCVYTASVKVCIKEAKVLGITIITPNNDGKNDELEFPGLIDFPDNTLKVFNRWGNIIFEAEGYQTKGILFNGERNGDRLPPDTYYYVLTFDNQVIKSALTILWD